MDALGVMYVLGEGVEKDAAKAFELFTKAAELTPDAYGNLGTAYFYGEGTEKDYAKAVECWTKAMEECADGPVKTQCIENLAESYFFGQGI